MQEEVLLHFETSSVAFEGMLSANPGEESLRELLRGRGPYGGSSISATIAPYEFDRVSVPSSVAAAPYVEDLLPDGGRDFLVEFETKMMHEDGRDCDTSQIGRHVDPLLAARPKEYAKLVQRMISIGLVSLTRDCKEELGLFFVWKKEKPGELRKTRLILDCRRVNGRFRSPPSVELVTGEGFSRIEVHDETANKDVGCNVVLADADVSDFFTDTAFEDMVSYEGKLE